MSSAMKTQLQESENVPSTGNKGTEQNVGSPTCIADHGAYENGAKNGTPGGGEEKEGDKSKEKKTRLIKEARPIVDKLLQALDKAPSQSPQKAAGRGSSFAYSKTPLKAFSSSETVSYEAFKSSGGLRSIVIAVWKHAEIKEIVEYGCDALATFAMFDDSAVTEMTKSGVVDAGVQAMRRAKDMPESVKVNVLKLLRALTQKEENRQSIAKAKGTEAIVDIMNNSTEQRRALSHAALLLSNLAFGNKDIKDEVGNLGGITAIAKAMSANPHQQTMQARGSLALRNLCFGSDSNQRIGGQSGAIEALVSAVQMHGGDREIVHQSSVALVNLSNENPTNRNCIVAVGGASAFLQLMKRYNTSMTVNDDCLAVLRNIVVESKAAQDEIGKGGGVKLIMDALDKFHKEEKVCTKACAAIRYLCFQPDNRVLVGENRGMDKVVQVLKQHLRSSTAVEHALLAIGNATFENEKNKVAVGDCGGLLAIVTVIEQHRLSAIIQEHGCRVMRNLVANSAVNATRAVENGAITTGVFAMMGYADNASVQEQACAMLVNMAECDGVIDKFRQADVMRLAERALVNHSRNRGVQLQAGVLIDQLNGYPMITPRVEDGSSGASTWDSTPRPASGRIRGASGRVGSGRVATGTAGQDKTKRGFFFKKG